MMKTILAAVVVGDVRGAGAGAGLADAAGDHGGAVRGRRRGRHDRARHRGAASRILGQQVMIENVGGAGGMTGGARVAKAAPDGYTVLLGRQRRLRRCRRSTRNRCTMR